MNDEELVEVVEAWELPYEVRTALTHNWSAEGVQILKERFTRDVLAALRSAGFQVFKPEDCERYHAWDDIADKDGTYFLVPADSGGSG